MSVGEKISSNPVLGTAQSYPGYRILRQIGQGGSAKVFSALSERDGSKVALKIFTETRRSGLADREIRALQTLRHPNIIPLIESFLDQDPQALCFELVEGETLSSYQAKLPYILPELGVWIAIQILSALEHAHDAKIIHRDLKPSNVLISNTGKVSITDFGLAKFGDASSITASNTVLGSPEFMSPEQAQGDVLTPKSDLFSLTSILYFLVTGTAPFSRDSMLATLAAVSRAEHEPASRRNPKISWALSRILEKGLSRNPEDRFQSAAEYRATLTNYLHALGLEKESFSLGQWLQDPSSQTTRYLKTMSEALFGRCETEIAAGHADEAYEVLSHLSLVAPSSQSVARLTAKISVLQENLRKQRERRKTALAAVPVLLLGIVATAWFARPKSGPALAPAPGPAPVVAKPVAVAPVQPASVKKPVAVAAPRPVMQDVQLELPDSMQAFWDGKEVDGNGKFSAPLGSHRLKLMVPGMKPFEQEIKVVRGEPTVVRVNSGASPDGGEEEQ